MKVPTLVTPRTRTPNQTQDYSRFRVDPEAYGVGLGRELQQLGATLAKREEKTNRFGALTALSDFETKARERLVEMQRDANPTGQGFVQLAESTFDQEAQNFLATLPPAMREEFAFRTSQIKQNIVGQALDFQYKAGDAYFRQGVSDLYEKARSGLDPRLGGDPSRLDEWKAQLNEAILATDLPTVEKAELYRNITMGLEGVGYRAAIAREAAQFGGNADTANLIKQEEGFRDTPYYDVNAYRVGYGSDTITLADGSVVPVEKGMRISREDAERDLARRIREFQAGAARDVGVSTWNALPGNVQAGLTSVAYNYGSLPKSVVAAVKTGDIPTIANAVASLSTNKDRRKREAEVILGTLTPPTEVDLDPRFANVPYEDKLALKEDATRDAIAAANEQAKVTAEAYESRLNSLLTNIHDGAAGRMDIDAFRQANPGMAYSDIERLDNALKNYSEGVGLAAITLQKIEGGGVIDPTSSEDRKGMNAIVGQQGLQRIANGDADIMTNGIVPLVEKAGDIPTDVVGTLIGMLRSNNQSRAIYALDSLSQLQDADFRAYNDRVPEDVQRDVSYWRNRRDLVPHDELFKQINPGVSQDERQARMVLRKQAEDLLAQKVDKVPQLQTLVQNVISSYAPWYRPNPDLSIIPWAAQGLQAEFQAHFIDAYERYGTVEDATKEAQELLKKSWAVTQVGEPILMKNPPEMVGYRPYNGSYDWIADEVRREYQLAPDAKFQLISDEQTQQEFEAYRRGEGHPPSYRIAIIDDRGVGRVTEDRQWFQVPTSVTDAEIERFDAQQSASIMRVRMEELQRTVDAARTLGVEVPAEDVAELETLRRDYAAARKRAQERTPNYETQYRSMGERARAAGAAFGAMVLPRIEVGPEDATD